MYEVYNVEETLRRYHELLAREPDFFLIPDCNIVMLACRLNIDSSYASQFVIRELRTTLGQLIRASRLRRMESMLRANPGRNVHELIHEVGFSDDLSFRRAYMEKYGELPSKSSFCCEI